MSQSSIWDTYPIHFINFIEQGTLNVQKIIMRYKKPWIKVPQHKLIEILTQVLTQFNMPTL